MHCYLSSNLISDQAFVYKKKKVFKFGKITTEQKKKKDNLLNMKMPCGDTLAKS